MDILYEFKNENKRKKCCKNSYSYISNSSNGSAVHKRKDEHYSLWTAGIIYKHKEQSWPLRWSLFTSLKGQQSRYIVIKYKTAYWKSSERKSFLHSSMLLWERNQSSFPKKAFMSHSVSKLTCIKNITQNEIITTIIKLLS